MKSCKVIELGLIGYDEASALQQRLVAARKAGMAPDVLLLCEHPHVITLGRNGKLANLLATPEALEKLGVEFYHTNRGGDVTYHGPGQLVGYPILNLGDIRRDVAWYGRQLEEIMIQTSASFGIETFRIPGRTGVWTKPPSTSAGLALDEEMPAEEKLGAIGVHLSRWVASHGFAYNVCANLRYFELIVPCGIPDRRATSLDKLLGESVSTAEVAPQLVAAFGKAFDMEMVALQREEMEEWLPDAGAHSETGHPTVIA